VIADGPGSRWARDLQRREDVESFEGGVQRVASAGRIGRGRAGMRMIALMRRVQWEQQAETLLGRH
jgi:hypothetical protein